MITSRYAARVTVTLAGNHPAEITTATSLPGHQGRPAVIVASGHTLTYCLGRAAVTVRAQAWSDALLKGRMLFPADYRAEQQVSAGVAAQIISKPYDTATISGFTAAAAPDQLPVLFVRVGPLTVACLDLLAVLSQHDAWQRADRAGAAVLWSDGQPAGGE